MRRMTRLARWRLWDRRASRRVLPWLNLAVDVVTGRWQVALLGDRGDAEHTVDTSVAPEVETMSHDWSISLAGRDGDGAGA
jgi:hypothetical protein